MINDPQERAVYVMERMELRGHRFHVASRETLRRAARRLSRSFNVHVPVLKFKRLSRYGVWEDDVITLDDERGMNYLTLAHEMAHHVVFNRCGHRAQDHGATFVRAYAQALEVLRIMPVASMRALCRKYLIRIA